jgi:predicted nucleotidyltransferase
LHGYTRATNDLDIVILLSEDNIKKFVSVIKRLKYKPKIPVELEDFISEENRKSWIKGKNMKVFSIYNPDNEFEHIDVLVQYGLDFKEAYKNRVVYLIEDVKIPVVSIPDLIKLKEEANRTSDRNDILALRKIMRLKGQS